MGKFIHIYIKTNKEVTKESLERKLNLAVDWYRYDDEIYIVYTTSPVDKWQARLLNLVKKGGKLFICELEVNNRNGWMNRDFWDWLKKHQAKAN